MSDSAVSRLDGQTTAECVKDVSATDSRMRGWLCIRARFSEKWKKRWFVLDNKSLRYGASEKKLVGKIPLDGARIREADKDGKQFAFCIELKSSRRVYYIHADDDVSRTKWMQAMCFAKVSHCNDDDDDTSSMCSIS